MRKANLIILLIGIIILLIFIIFEKYIVSLALGVIMLVLLGVWGRFRAPNYFDMLIVNLLKERSGELELMEICKHLKHKAPKESYQAIESIVRQSIQRLEKKKIVFINHEGATITLADNGP